MIRFFGLILMHWTEIEKIKAGAYLNGQLSGVDQAFNLIEKNIGMGSKAFEVTGE